MQKQIKVLLTLLMVLFLAISCAKNNPNNPNNDSNNNNNNNNNNNQTEKPAWKQNENYALLIKDWQNASYATEIYQIEENGNDKIEFIVLDPNGDVSYSITVSEIVWNSDNKSGMMYGIYSVEPAWYPGYLNKWYAILFENLSESTLTISQAVLQDGTAAADTLEEAKNIFTKENKAFELNSPLVPYKK